MTAKRKGKRGQARRISVKSARIAKRYGLSAKRFNKAQRYGASLAIDPRMLRQLLMMMQQRAAYAR